MAKRTKMKKPKRRNIIAVAARSRSGAGRHPDKKKRGQQTSLPRKSLRMTKRVTLQPGDLVCYNVSRRKRTSLAHVVEVRHPKTVKACDGRPHGLHFRPLDQSG